MTSILDYDITTIVDGNNVEYLENKIVSFKKRPIDITVKDIIEYRSMGLAYTKMAEGKLEAERNTAGKVFYTGPLQVGKFKTSKLMIYLKSLGEDAIVFLEEGQEQTGHNTTEFRERFAIIDKKNKILYYTKQKEETENALN